MCQWEALGMGSAEVGPRLPTLSLASCSVMADSAQRMFSQGQVGQAGDGTCLLRITIGMQ